MTPIISVVIPCWNGESWISRAIQSVLDQNVANLELIVVDDGSSDQSIDIIKSFSHQIRWTSCSNQGACVARNAGAAMSTAEFVMFLDADDYLLPSSLGPALLEMGQHDIGLFTFDDEIAGVRRKRQHFKPDITALGVFQSWLKGRFIAPCSVIWRRSFFTALGGWDETVLKNQDGDLMLRALLKKPSLCVSPRHLGVYVHHDSPMRISRISGNKAIEANRKVLEKIERLIDDTDTERRAALGRGWYGIAYQAFDAGASKVGREALSRSRALGFHGHPGNLVHQILARLVGLEIKQCLARAIRSQKDY